MLASTEEETPGAMPPAEESQAIALGGEIRSLACRYLLGLVPEAEYQRRFRALAAEYQHLRRAGGRRLRN
ncbi:MAG TPA: hypothetical protein VJ548_14465 [Azospira sp.]|nr:hypothetical protein [Azospira sp.]